MIELDTIYNMDCLEGMRDIPDGMIDAVITDPPYGIKINKSHRLSVSRGFGGETWDDKRCTSEVVFIVDHFGSKPIVVWGGNYYTDILPISRGWLIWDKLNDGRDFGEAELAWSNIDTVIRRFKKRPINMDGGKVHPTQKPIDLIAWCIEKYTKPGDTILDPFMGSGTTAIACLNTGRHYIGFEKEQKYYQIALERIRNNPKRLL
jgi:DNA modification methylase